jgi:hypothetical protein
VLMEGATDDIVNDPEVRSNRKSAWLRCDIRGAPRQPSLQQVPR